MSSNPVLSLVFPFAVLLFASDGACGESLPWANSSFEVDSNRDGVPDFWTFFSDTVELVSSTETARSGTASIRLEDRGLTASPNIPGEGYYAVVGNFCGMGGGETVALSLPSARAGLHRAPFSASLLSASRYFPVQVAGRFGSGPLGVARVDVYSRPGDLIRGDDFSLFGNRFSDPDFDSGLDGWESNGDATVEGSAARLAPGARLNQKVSASPNASVLHAFRARSRPPGAWLVASLQLEDPVGKNLDVETRTFQVDAGWTTYSCRTVHAATATLGKFSVSVPEGEDSDFVEVDSFRALSMETERTAFSPNGDGIYDRLPLFLWSGSKTDSSCLVRDARGAEIRRLHEGTHEPGRFRNVEWDGLDNKSRRAPDGLYTLVFSATDADLGPLVLERRVRVETDRRASPPAIQPNVANLFPRGFWLAAHDSFRTEGPPAVEATVEAEYDRLYSIARAAGANAAIPAALDLQYAAVERAASRHEILQFPSLFGPELLLRFEGSRDEKVLWDGFERALEPWSQSPWFGGTYPLDEPTFDLLPRALMANKMLETLAPEKVSFHSLADLAVFPNYLDTIEPAVAAFHHYPFREGTVEGNLGEFLSTLERARNEALGRRLPFWFTLPAFAEPGKHRFPTPGELELCGNLSLCLGAKGMFCFLLNTSRHAAVEGILDRDFQPGPLLAPAKKLFAWVAQNESILLDLEIVEDRAIAKGTGYVRTHAASDGRVFFMVVNTDLSNPYDIDLHFVEPPDSFSGLQDLTDRTEFKVVRENGKTRARIDVAPGGIRLLETTEWRSKNLPRPNLDPNRVESAFSRFKGSLKRKMKPVWGDFDWKNVGNVYRPELGTSSRIMDSNNPSKARE